MDFYEIVVDCEIEKCWEPAFKGLKLEKRGDGTTLLSGILIDQSAVYGVINTIRDLGMEILRLEKQKTSI